jgi:topoisomerase-4 subunit B
LLLATVPQGIAERDEIVLGQWSLPVIGEDAEDLRVAPAVTKLDRFPRSPLVSHSDSAQNSCRCVVARVASRCDPMEAESVKCELHKLHADCGGNWEDRLMRDSSKSWENTTHDWAAIVDHEHLAQIREQPTTYAPGGIEHLVLEVLAYAADGAEAAGRAGRGIVTLHADGSVSVADDARGTDTRVDTAGRVIKKPVMATKDLRFFDHPDAETLPDGHPRRGMSVVAALSEWLIHTNRRTNGSWAQTYEHGVPTTYLTPIADDGTTGTAVHFQPDTAILMSHRVMTSELVHAASWPQLRIELVDKRPS